MRAGCKLSSQIASITAESPASRRARDAWELASGSLRALGPVAVVVVVQLVWFGLPKGVLAAAFVFGALASLMAVALTLVYRLNKVVNFAQADLGAAPAVLAFGLVGLSGVNYFLGLATGIVGSVVLSAVVEMVVIRRFAKSPRLVFTVATIGLSQTVVVISLLLPLIWPTQVLSNAVVSFPWHFQFSIGNEVFDSNSVVALVVSVGALAGVATWLRLSDIGVATRASADRRDRAAMLGIPVNRLQTVTWCVAGVLSFLSIFLEATIVGLPADPQSSIEALVTALSALALGGFESLPVIALSAVAIVMLQQAVLYDYPADPALPFAVTAGVVVFAVIARRLVARPARDVGAVWSLASVARELPPGLRQLWFVRAGRPAGGAILLAAVATLPLWLAPSYEFEVATLLALALIGLSIVVLTGWTGLVSLGQMSFAAAGAAAGAVALVDWHFDLALALAVAAAAGAVVAIVIGIPALRFGGIFIGVTTLAFALAASSYFFDPAEFSWVPQQNILSPWLFAAVRITSQGNQLELCLGVLVIALAAVSGIRRSRAGRVYRAIRSNERAAASYGVQVTAAKLSAFAVSGGLAGLGGCLLLVVNGQYVESSAFFVVPFSITVFVATAVGGLGSATGAVIGAALVEGSAVWLPPSWQTLPGGAGLLLVLIAFPEGLTGPLFRGRDRAVAWVARSLDRGRRTGAASPAGDRLSEEAVA
jgi:branched-chain amino acid transport system permease protein